MLIPAFCVNSAAVRCIAVELPPCPIDSAPGFALASAIVSAALCAGTFADATSTKGISASSVIGARSFGSNGIDELRCGFTVSAPAGATPSV